MVIDGDAVTYTPKTAIRTTSDVNMFLTRHRLLHTSFPRVPMSISHCWINAELEREKFLQNDFGYNETGDVSPPRNGVDYRISHNYNTKKNPYRKGYCPTRSKQNRISIEKDQNQQTIQV